MRLLVQAMRFAAVGALATVLHVAVGLTLAEGLGAPALWANLAAFAAAVLVSYFGNLAWTFGLGAEGLTRLPRFLVVAALGLLANQIIVFGVVDLAGWSYRAALAAVVLVVPAVSYGASRQWVFAARANPGEAR